MAGSFELYKDKGGKFRFRLKATNGQTILASQGYVSKAGAMNGINSVRTNCADPDCFDVKTTKAGHRFNLIARNGKVVGTSESYKTPAACTNGVKSVQKNAPTAPVKEV